MAEKRVLVVDDQRDIRRLLAVALNSIGPSLDVIEVPSAEEAMLVSSRRPVDLLVTDISLPGISGLELVKKFRARKSDMKIILITGLTDSRTRKLLDAADVDAYYYKPVEMTDFLAKVERLLGLSGVPASAGVVTGAAAASHPSTGIESAGGVPASVAGHLSTLRDRFKASAAVLVDERGASLAYSGDASSVAAYFPALITLGRAGLEASRQMGQDSPENLLCVAGQGVHVCLTMVGTKMLILVGSLLFRQALLGDNPQVITQAAETIQHLLTTAPPPPAPAEAVEEPAAAPVEPPAEAVEEPEVQVDETAEVDLALDALLQAKVDEVAPEEAEAALAEIDALFGSAKALPETDVDSFWDEIAEKNESVKTNENVLTWEEARKMGLTEE
jgi:CheY-like chemotaxis protein